MGHGFIKPELVSQHGHDAAITSGQVGDGLLDKFVKLSLVDLHDKILLAEKFVVMKITSLAARGERQFAQNRSVYAMKDEK
jgi:hypothetical protein